MKAGISVLLAAGGTGAALALPALAARGSDGQTYVVTLTGSQQSVAVRSGVVRDDQGCTYRVNDVDRQLLIFSAQTRVRLTLRPGGTLPRISFRARVAAAGSRHRESKLTGGDASVCNPSRPPTTKPCPRSIVHARLTLHPAAGSRIVLDGVFAPGDARRACATTLTAPDRFPLPFTSRLVLPDNAANGLVARERLHRRTKIDIVAKTTDVRWTVALKRAT